MSAIGAERQAAQNYFKSFELSSFRNILSPADFADAALRTGCQPRRSSRVLLPQVVAWLMMYVSLQVTSMAGGLACAWGFVAGILPVPLAKAVSEEAFVQARSRLKRRFWRRLFDALANRYLQAFDDALKFKGRYLVKAVDGTELTLGKSKRVAGFFGRPTNHKGPAPRPMARLVSVVNVLSGFCHRFVLVPLKISESLCLKHLIQSLVPLDILLLDAGFFCYLALVLIRGQKAHYLMRINVRAQGFAKKIRKLGPDDWLVAFTPGRETLRRCPGLPETILCRLICYRMAGFRDAYLICSLTNPAVFSRDELVSLYHKRWRIETIHRDWKHVLAAANFRSQTPLGIHKELYAQLMLWNLTRWVMSQAAVEKGCDAMMLSFQNAVTQIKSMLLPLALATPKNAQKWYRHLLDMIAATAILQRPGRSYPRPHDGKIKDKGKGRKKLPAKLPAT